MTMTNEKRSIAIAVAAAITLATTIPLSAAPVLTNTAGVKATISNPVTDVRYYRRGYNRGYGIAGPQRCGWSKTRIHESLKSFSTTTTT